jgi:hypothetical protein
MPKFLLTRRYSTGTTEQNAVLEFTVHHFKISHSTYSGHKITPSLSYVTIRGGEKMERARRSKMAKSLSMYSFIKNTFSLLILTQSVAF